MSLIFQKNKVAYGFFGKEIPGSHAYSIKENNEKIARENIKHLQAFAAEIFKCPDISISLMKQVHGDQIILVDEIAKLPKEADGQLTTTPNVALAIQTADCLPIIFYEEEKGVIAACHSGWPGSFAQIGAKTLKKMQNLGADISKIKIIIGPAISQQSYEVTEEFYDRFIGQSIENSRFFLKTNSEGKYLFNLKSYNVNNLLKAGIIEKNLEIIDVNTYENRERFYSFRRFTKNEDPNYGSNISLIYLKR